MVLTYNGTTAGKSFNQWCDEHGIIVVDAWDKGMYGNIGYKVRKDGVEYEANAYQSTTGNFTFDLII